MDGEQNGSQETTQDNQEDQAQGQQATSAQVGGGNKTRNAAAPDFEKQIAELKQASADERIDFELQLAGCRNVKAARAVLDDYEGDIDKMKEAELWLFAKHLGDSKGATGKTGFPNAGAASDAGKTVQHWHKISGLVDTDDKKSE